MALSRSIRAKEAAKTALAMMLVYGLALQSGWMNPYWAAIAVTMISLATAGQSIHKGLLRIAGTIPGCLAALIIMSLAPQSPVFFILLVAAWLFVTTYLMMVDKQRAYLWHVAGFVCLIIVLAGPQSSQNIFEHAIYRSVETVMGVVVYTMISVFLWPQNNAGMIKKVSLSLVATQWQLISGGLKVLNGKAHTEDLGKLRTQEFQLLDQLTQVLLAEGSENYEVYELRHLWARLHGLLNSLRETIDRWGSGLNQLPGIDIEAIFPDLPKFYCELENRFKQIQLLSNGNSCDYQMRSVPVPIDVEALKELSTFDRAALAMTKKDLETIDALSRSVLECVQALINGDSVELDKELPVAGQESSRKGFHLPVFDPDHLKGAAFAGFATICGFVVWIMFNPPGHASWFELSGIVAMMVASTQQLKVTILAKPIFLASVLCLLAYVFIMPRLSSFYGLGSLIFVLVFINCYFFTGLAKMAGMVAIFTEISVQNQQSYNFAAMANSLVFTLCIFFFVFALSFLLSSSRPEKALLAMSKRYFRSMEFLMGSLMVPVSNRSAWFRWRQKFYRNDIKSLPAKIASWGKAINPQLFPANSPQQVQSLIASLELLSVRTESLLQVVESAHTRALVIDTAAELKPWLAKIEATFCKWATHPETGAGPVKDLQNQLDKALNRLEAQIDIIMERVDKSGAQEGDGESYYRLLGGLRGITEACVGFAGVSDEIDWRNWREEKFS